MNMKCCITLCYSALVLRSEMIKVKLRDEMNKAIIIFLSGYPCSTICTASIAVVVIVIC